MSLPSTAGDLAMRVRTCAASPSSLAAWSVSDLAVCAVVSASRLVCSSVSGSRQLGPRLSHSAARICSAAVAALRVVLPTPPFAIAIAIVFMVRPKGLEADLNEARDALSELETIMRHWFTGGQQNERDQVLTPTAAVGAMAAAGCA
jgi:hypothetical protein